MFFIIRGENYYCLRHRNSSVRSLHSRVDQEALGRTARASSLSLCRPFAIILHADSISISTKYSSQDTETEHYTDVLESHLNMYIYAGC